jgi:hypothetical protein
VAYGCTSVLLATVLAAYGYSPLVTGALLAVTGRYRRCCAAHRRLATPDGVAFLILVTVWPIGVWLASRLTPTVESAPTTNTPGVLGPSKARAHRLAALFAVDAAGGGLVTSRFQAYYLTTRYCASRELLGVLLRHSSATGGVGVGGAQTRQQDRARHCSSRASSRADSTSLYGSGSDEPHFDPTG